MSNLENDFANACRQVHDKLYEAISLIEEARKLSESFDKSLKEIDSYMVLELQETLQYAGLEIEVQRESWSSSGVGC